MIMQEISILNYIELLIACLNHVLSTTDMLIEFGYKSLIAGAEQYRILQTTIPSNMGVFGSYIPENLVCS